MAIVVEVEVVLIIDRNASCAVGQSSNSNMDEAQYGESQKHQNFSSNVQYTQRTETPSAQVYNHVFQPQQQFLKTETPPSQVFNNAFQPQQPSFQPRLGSVQNLNHSQFAVYPGFYPSGGHQPGSSNSSSPTSLVGYGSSLPADFSAAPVSSSSPSSASTAFVASSSSKSAQQGEVAWYPDSAATHHVTNDTSALHSGCTEQGYILEGTLTPEGLYKLIPLASSVHQVLDNDVNITSDVVVNGGVDVSTIQPSFNSESILGELVQVDGEHREIISDTGLLSCGEIVGSEPVLNVVGQIDVEGLTSDVGLLSHDETCDETIETDRHVRVGSEPVLNGVDQIDAEGFTSDAGLLSHDETCIETVETDRHVRVGLEPVLNGVDQIDEDPTLHVRVVPDQIDEIDSHFEATNVPGTESVSPETDMGEALQESVMPSRSVPSQSGLSEKFHIGNTHPMFTRGKNGIKKPKLYQVELSSPSSDAGVALAEGFI
ncbi:hypothetical protein GQ457_HM001400 [Hibiscus cannabinus]